MDDMGDKDTDAVYIYCFFLDGDVYDGNIEHVSLPREL